MKVFPFIPSALVLATAITNAQEVIYPGSLSFDPLSSTHGMEFEPNKWSIDATDSLLTDSSTGNPINYDYSATPTPYGNWSLGRPAQGPGNFLESTFSAGFLNDAVDSAGNPVALVNGSDYQLRFAIKPTEFSTDGGTTTWAIGDGDTYSVDWTYGMSTATSAVTLAVDTWQEVFFDFTYQSGSDFIFLSQDFNGGTPSVSQLSGIGGTTPVINLEAPTLQVAAPTAIPEPSITMLGGLALLALYGRRRR